MYIISRVFIYNIFFGSWELISLYLKWKEEKVKELKGDQF